MESRMSFPMHAPPMEGFVYVCPSSNIGDGEMKSIGGFCVGRAGGQAFFIDDVCYHSQASLSLGDMEDLNFDFQLTSAPAAADGAAAAGWCVRCPKHRKKFCGGLYFSTTTGHAYVKGPAEKFKNSWRVGVWAVAEKDGFLYRSLTPSNHTPKSAAPSMKSHAPWRIVNRFDCSSDSYILQLQRLQDQAAPAQPPPLRDEPDLSCFHVDIGLETDDNHYIARPYTPLSTEEEYYKGTMSLIVKTYTQGKFTPLLDAKAVGSTIFSSPVEPTLALPSICPSFVGIFGGTGVTPIYALARAFLRAKRPVTLMTFNHTPQDYLGEEQLRQLQQELDSDSRLMRCTPFFTASNPSNRIDVRKVLAHAPAAPGAAVVVCGPAGFMEACRVALLEAGYRSQDLHLLDS